MTTSGEPPTGAGGVSEPDWIDQILERASNQVERPPERRASHARPPIVPDTPGSRARSSAARSVASGNQAPANTAQARQDTADSLAEIRWVDSVDVTPASTPIVQPDRTLTAQSVGRSAWDRDLATVGDREPEGWDQLSWQDLDGDTSAGARELHQPNSFTRLLREWGPVLFAAVAIALFTRLVLVQAYHIPSQSMVPTLEDGDRVVVNRLSYQFGEVDRGQVVVFEKPAGTDGENDLIKRIIGLPGETIRFVDNQVYIDGFRVEEPYLSSPDSTRPRLRIPGCEQAEAASDLCEIPEGHVFVMGDNRLGSSDSRVFGPIPTESIVGRAFLRVWPLNNLGQL